MAKRKRNTNGDSAAAVADISSKKLKSSSSSNPKYPVTIQIIAGSYEGVLHGVAATISPKNEDKVEFADTFLLTAHTSSLRCLALSPPSAPISKQTQKIILASGSKDQDINLYHLSAHAPSKINVPVNLNMSSKAIVQNPQNRELGSLRHHSSSITALFFPNRSKLMSSSEDSTIAVTRTRDWSLLSSIKVPIPKPVGRPSGDTAPLGGAPSGINDFAVHPSMKLMISVGKGEKSMRLWNLVTGKKAGALNFGRGILGEVGEGKYSSGEGRKVAWGATDVGEEFCVGFERGILVFGMDSKPKCKVVSESKAKIHELCYVQVGDEEDVQVLAVSTEDGRVLFYSTRPADLVAAKEKDTTLASAKLIAQLGGKDVGLSGRIKDFSILNNGEGSIKDLIVSTACSDGNLRIWKLAAKDLSSHAGKAKQVGELLGTYETPNRITCIKTFIMLPKMEGAEDERIEDFEGFEDVDEDSSSDSD